MSVISQQINTFVMKRISLLTIAIILGLCFCAGQSRNTDKLSVPEQSSADNNRTNKPQENIKVNREYDKNGNLISYDSTYSYSYSSSMDQMDPQKRDSMLKDFKNFFKEDRAVSNDSVFDHFFSEGSFAEDDFFSNRMRENLEFINRQFAQLDSAMNGNGNNKTNPYQSQTVPKVKKKINSQNK
jgi:hypothetical protein